MKETVFFFLLAFFISFATAEPARFVRHPAPSPDGQNIAFSYGGDIWRVPTAGGQAWRLTAHPAYEHSPHWSPDGRWIAFSAQREGDDDVYIVSAEGGAVRRLTFIDADDQVWDFTSDGSAVLFGSRRDDLYPDFTLLYSVPITGGTPMLLTAAYCREVVSDSSGRKLLLTRGDSQWWRRNYRSSGSSQVWMLDCASGDFEAVTDTGVKSTGGDFRRPTARWPMWGKDGAIYIASERDQIMNIWKRAADGNWAQITHYKNDGVRFPVISRNGTTIAYEQGQDIYILSEDSLPRRLEIMAPIDPLDAAPRRLSYSDRADRAAFAPDGKQMFIEVRGEVFAGRIVGEEDKAARGSANNLTDNNPARDGDITVSPGGDSLIVVSDRAGSRDLYLVYSDDPETKELSRALRLKWEPLATDPIDEHTPRWSPDGSAVAFIRGQGNLIVLDLKKRIERQVLSGWSLSAYNWSPDGKWFAYCREDDDYNSDVWIIPTAGGTEVNVSCHPDDDDTPVWSGDGRKLAFRSKRRENNWDIYFVFLRKSDDEKRLEDFAEEIREKSARKKDKNKDEKDDKGKKEEDKEAGKTEVIIDTTDIYQRVRALTNLAGEEGVFAISPDGKRFAFSANHEGQSDIYAIDWNGENIKRLTNGGAAPKWLEFDDAGKRVRYLDGSGRVKSVDESGGVPKDHPFDAKLVVDLAVERRRKFVEIRRVLGDRFYDRDFHGHNWLALCARYEPLALAAKCEEDFGDAVEMLFGEINASHMGYNLAPGRLGRGRGGRLTGRLGLDFAPHPLYYLGSPASLKPGQSNNRRASLEPGLSHNIPASENLNYGLLIAHILPEGPCDRENCRLKAGEWLVSVNGKKLAPGINLYELLDDQVAQRVELTVWDGKTERRHIVRPISRWEESELRYKEWVKEHRQAVDSLSDRQLGYLHIRGMGEPSLARFEAELFSVGWGKAGLVIDVRYNGGGWTADYLLAMLQVKRHATTFPRGGGPGYPQGRLPLYFWTKPIIVLCNEHSFSNAEIFSHAIKTLGRGSLVGAPTPGGVISTGEHSLVDGSSFRVPLRGWYVGTVDKPDPTIRLEGNGASPDYIVPLKPNEIGVVADRQLEAAVATLLRQIKEQR